MPRHFESESCIRSERPGCGGRTILSGVIDESGEELLVPVLASFQKLALPIELQRALRVAS